MTPSSFQRRPRPAALLASSGATGRGDRATTAFHAPGRAVGAVPSRRADRGVRRSLPAPPHTPVDRALRVRRAPVRLPRLAVRCIGRLRRDPCARCRRSVTTGGPALSAGRADRGPRHGVPGPPEPPRTARIHPRGRRSVVRNRGAAHPGRPRLGGVAGGQFPRRGAFPLRPRRDVRSGRGGRGAAVRRCPRRLVVHHVLRALLHQPGGSRGGGRAYGRWCRTAA